jgi:hypothetical protein
MKRKSPRNPQKYFMLESSTNALSNFQSTTKITKEVSLLYRVLGSTTLLIK